MAPKLTPTGMLTATGVVLSLVLPLPSCPYWLLPQAQPRPLLSRARLLQDDFWHCVRDGVKPQRSVSEVPATALLSLRRVVTLVAEGSPRILGARPSDGC